MQRPPPIVSVLATVLAVSFSASTTWLFRISGPALLYCTVRSAAMSCTVVGKSEEDVSGFRLSIVSDPPLGEYSAFRLQEVSLHIILPFHLVASNVETLNHPEDLEIRRSEWHARIRLTLRSPSETHHRFTAQIRYFFTSSRPGTCAQLTAFVRGAHEGEEPKSESPRSCGLTGASEATAD